MELELIRTYYNTGTNGCLFAGDELLCFTTEAGSNSTGYRRCLPEGRYVIYRGLSKQYGACVQVINEEDKEAGRIIALPEMVSVPEKCIVPATWVTAPGKGLGSKQAMERLLRLTGSSGSNSIYLTIKS